MNSSLDTNQPLRKRDMSMVLMCLGFFVVFTIGSFASGYFTVLAPYMRWQEAQSWPTVPCRIGLSEIVTVGSEIDSDNRTQYLYSLKVQYFYQWNSAAKPHDGASLPGMPNTPEMPVMASGSAVYQSEKVHVSGFQNATTGNRSDWTDLQNKYPMGSTTVCFVNPRDPSQAFLDRDFHTSDFALGIFMTGIFFFVGILFLVVGWKVA